MTNTEKPQENAVIKNIIEALENLAPLLDIQIDQALIKSWFVDFEPTRAKIAAKIRWRAINEIIETSSPTCYAEAFNDACQDKRSLEETMTQAAMAAISGKSVEELDQCSPEQQQQLKEVAALFPDVLVESELGELPEGWEASSIVDICDF